ncbi:MAG: MATE family efflux transporter [Eubacterium sp.]|nr:MATE family efflux transporter [Eubacterium sp.]
MAEKSVKAIENPLGTKPLGRLLFSLAVPTAIGNVVNAMYNIVDQIFIGQGVGTLGNAATSVSFPLTTICLAIGLMLGLGAASGFNLELGQAHAASAMPEIRKAHEERAKEIVARASGTMVLSGIIILILVRIFLSPMLKAFGATDTIMPYAAEYAGITSWGIPFLLFMMGANPIVRADRSPRYSMAAVIIGAVLNTILDPVFIFVCGWGIAGAAWATVISQVVSAVMLAAYFPRFRSVHFTWSDFLPHCKADGSTDDLADDAEEAAGSFGRALVEYAETVIYVCKLGINSLIFQMSTVIVQITINNMLKIYGAQTVYGSDIPIAVCGIVMKINVIFISLMIGLISGAQPICSYNYGAGKYTRVRGTVKLFTIWAVIIGTFSWLIFQLFPDKIILLFGNGGGNELYFEYAERFMRTFLFFTFINGLQVCSATFFPSIGKPLRGAFLSFSKQILIFMPVLVIMTQLYGLDGIMYAQAATDLLAALLSVSFLAYEMHIMPREDA